MNHNVKTMIASYVEEKHKDWDKYLPEFRFALNSAVHESTEVTPAELNLSRLLKGPMDAGLSPQLGGPDTPAYATANQIAEFKKLVNGNMQKAKQRQKQNYDKGRRDGTFSDEDHVWVRTHPYSKADRSFSAKLAPRWKGPYRVIRKVGPLNFEVVLEDTGEDLRVVKVTQLKPCYPTAEEMDREQHRRILEIFEEESDEKDFPGFSA